MPILRNVEGFGSNGGVRARLTDLALMKAEAWMGRDENRDLMDFQFLLEKMDEKGENWVLHLTMDKR